MHRQLAKTKATSGKQMPSYTSKQAGAIKKTDDGYTYLNPADFAKDFAADLPLKEAEFESRSQILTAATVFSAPMKVAAWTMKPSWGIVAADDKIINPDLERFYYQRAQQPYHRVGGCKPFGVRVAPEGSGRGD